MITKTTIEYLEKKYSGVMNKTEIEKEFLMCRTEVTAIFGKGRIFTIDNVVNRLEELV